MARTRPRIESHHAEWLSLVETSGPFLTVPTLKRVLPDGLDSAPEALAALRIAHTEWRDDPNLRERWIRFVLDDVLELAGSINDASDADPSHRVPEHGVTIRPSLVARDHTQDGNPPVLLVHAVPTGTRLDRSVPGETWAASPIDRAAELARASEVPLALVTDGDRWTLVWARPGEATGTCTWRSEVWLEEPVTLRAFVTLLGARRFFVVPEDEGLARLLNESASKQQEVADQLGAQVRRAVELLIATLDRADRNRHGELLENVDSAEVYRGAVTVMMRLVFLFVAEERRLLPLDHPTYAETLAASTLRAQLQERADRDSEDPLERSNAGWHRVLALFRAVHGGIEHDALRLPAYGGGLFDPDRYPFLEGRPPRTGWHDVAAQPLPVDDRTMLHILDSLQTLEQGGVRVLLSYQSLDVEQIGHVYEGLLDHTALRQTDTVLALDGKLEPEIALSEIESWADDSQDALAQRLAKETGRSAAAIKKSLNADLDEAFRARLGAVCGNDDELASRIEPYAGLLREDLRGDPLVFLAGALFVTQALDRRSSGTYYTPRQLAEEVVRHALDPVAYAPGPAEGGDRAEWRLRPASELLDLKIADIAMGSGAFLVAACRYLAARLLEAWEGLGVGEWTVYGAARSDEPADPGLPADPDERQQLAHRLVTERCLYGVDKNPMAVEMAKVSLWLITLAKDRPFSFLDHAVRAGDSLMGINDPEQLRRLHIDPRWHRQASAEIDLVSMEQAVDRALRLRRDLEAFTVRDVSDAARKGALLAEAEAALRDARLLADLVVSAALAQLDGADPLAIVNASDVRAILDAESSLDEREAARRRVHAFASAWLVETRAAVGDLPATKFDDRTPFHWALEFPEVLAQGGFDAIVGNPPFQGGQKITRALGNRYRDYLVEWLAGGRRGSADLVAYFYLRAAQLLRPGGSFGLIATNTLAQGDTREVGLEQVMEESTFHRAISSQPWPGGASIEMAGVWGRRGGWAGERFLDHVAVAGITPALQLESRVSGKPERLAANRGRSFIGSLVLGLGFVLTDEEARELLSADARNADVVRPYLVGEDLNGRPDMSPSKWVIDFRDWSLERAAAYAEPFARVERLVKPQREKTGHALKHPWWLFERSRPELYRTLGPLSRCLVVARVSKTVQPAIVSTEQVFNEKVVVFPFDDYGHFGLMTSGFHWWWAVSHSSTLRLDTQYTPSDCFDTFAMASLTEDISRIGAALDQHRRGMMLRREEGLTKTYNRFHDAADHADDVVRLRKLHVELDHAVRDAYGATDLDLDHGFHSTKFGVRYTFAPVPRQEVLDRLLTLNLERFAVEKSQGLHVKKAKPKRGKPVSVATMSLDGLDA